MWLFYQTTTAIVINIVLLVFLIVFVRNGIEIFNDLYIDDKEAVTGK